MPDGIFIVDSKETLSACHTCNNGASNETSIPFTGISVGGDGTRVGWTVGAGFDYAFTNNWFAGLEYRYSQYQSKSFVYPIPILNLGFVGFKQELSNNQVTARIGYKF